MVEDTSVHIEALSTPEASVPGADIKFWMQSMTFEELDRLIRASGNDRTAVVTSHVGISVPAPNFHDTPFIEEIFSSCTDGFITTTEMKVETQPFYPWLDGKSFNKWFIPNGCGIPLGALPIKEADRHDFRSGAVEEAVNWLQNNAFDILPPCRQTTSVQPPPKRVLLVSGYSCSGKTTFSEALADKFDHIHCEASDFMRFACYEKHGWGAPIKVSWFAKQALNEDSSLVPRLIHQFHNNNGSDTLLITGLRAPTEVESIVDHFPESEVTLVFIDAGSDIRYGRALRRGRRSRPSSRSDFARADAEQTEMGLDRVRDRADILMENNGTLPEFVASSIEIAARCGAQNRPEQLNLLNLDGVRGPNTLFAEVLQVLNEHFDSGEYFTTTEIAKMINDRYYKNGAKRKSKNNVSRIFNQYSWPHYEVETTNSVNRFRLSQTGRSVARAISQTLSC